jgi:hypothetical protein
MLRRQLAVTDRVSNLGRETEEREISLPQAPSERKRDRERKRIFCHPLLLSHLLLAAAIKAA